MERAQVEVSAEAQAAAAVEVDQQLQLAADLQQLFSSQQHPPDLEAGCMAAVHGPAGSAVEGQSLLQLDLSVVGPKQRSDMPQRYLVVSTQVAEALADAPSRDAQIALLEALPEYRFPGVQQLQAEALLQAVRLQQERQQQQQGSRGPSGSSGFLIPHSV